MMMDLLTGLAVWMAAAVALGLLIGRAVHGYGVTDRTALVPLVGTDGTPMYERAA